MKSKSAEAKIQADICESHNPWEQKYVKSKSVEVKINLRETIH